MTLELSLVLYFDAAHSLRRVHEVEGSRRVHGHTYHVQVTVIGTPQPTTGMVVDLAELRAHLDHVKAMLDHHLLDHVSGLGTPTLENLCLFIARQLSTLRPPVSCVRVWREASGDSCVLRLAE